MHNKSANHIATLLVLLLILSACNYPGTGNPTATPQGTVTITAGSTTETSTPVETYMPPDAPSTNTPISKDAILTEVAATLYAIVTQTAKAAPPITATEPESIAPPAPTKAPTNTALPSTNTPTATNTSIPRPTNTMIPTSTATATQPGYTPIPPEPGVWITYAFRVRNIHLQDCNINYVANFEIYSTAKTDLQSSSIQLIDRNSNTTLAGPEINNNPFLATDRTCISVGASTLSPESTAYVGSWLGPKSLQTHTIKAIIKLCTLENIQGACYQATIEFVVP